MAGSPKLRPDQTRAFDHRPHLPKRDIARQIL
jgi:hypothetical protein